MIIEVYLYLSEHNYDLYSMYLHTILPGSGMGKKRLIS